MIPKPGVSEQAARSANILVVDDDRRVRELLEIALTAHGFGVLTAADGDEGIKRALGQRPDLVVLDVRLPKKSGLEVCDVIRGDADDPSVPIILVSAAVETDARLQAFARGADDYLSKPFSPKELIARIKRLLVRHSESRAALRRAQELERELARARDEARRARLDSRREQGLRELAAGIGRDLLRTLDRDALAERVLTAVQGRLGIGVAGLLVRERPGGSLIPCAVRGDGFERLAGLETSADGELAQVLLGLGRPVRSAELERLPELRAEIAPFVAKRFSVMVPLQGRDGLEALLVMDERLDGMDPSRSDLELLVGLSEIAAVAFENSQRFRAHLHGLLAMAIERAHAGNGSGPFLSEAAVLVTRAARMSQLSPRLRDLIRHGASLGRWGSSCEGGQTLEWLRALDPSGRVAELMKMLEWSAEPDHHAGEIAPEVQRACLLLRIAHDYAEARARGAGMEEALAIAVERSAEALDAATRQALNAIAIEGFFPESSTV